jgi:acetolactate decarboxylase
MPTLTCDISETLMRAIQARSQKTGEPVAHIVMSSLADTLEIDHATLFQVSTSTALVEGVYGGVVTIGELKQHGSFGLGTFDGLDGEMLALDGHFYRVLGDGTVRDAGDDARVPFAVVTEFRAEREFTLDRVESFDDLSAQLDRRRDTGNLFFGVRIDGYFTQIRTRALCKTASGVSLVDATAHQPEFVLTEVTGTAVGFWTPLYARTINVAGWHLHFVNDERTSGGHLLDCRGVDLRVQMQDLADIRIAMPETAAFLQADLSQDPSAELDLAERGGKHDAR